ncbi:Bug family tripartite tricarboxylate transporter substrate binding protein [Paracoccus thiocyanatus]|uniref:Tripartite-type tricarboxylate transporter, receptor component TctC n=1 Tax=Paracoccus thiocyanatus TaxID=34006 RepID=A0A3D8PEZ9_9RHOB|nr:tripartite tricarboxylate transporter substrate binding protein [Paracoccus thiocyanatus]RDW14037.1 hypothetical protein DIE28_04625 [Paracoccus thiocyanatus]
MGTRLPLLAKGTTAAIALCGAFVGAATAEDLYPEKPIRIIVGYSPGAIVDYAARQIGHYLSEELSVPVVIENRVGAGGHLASSYVARANPDGYTLLFFETGLVTAPALGLDLEYDPKTDLTPISIVASGAYFIYGNPGNEAETIQGAVALLKDHPDEYFYGSSGNGALNHIGFEMFLQEVGGAAKGIHYQGSGPVKVDILADRINFSMATAAGLVQEYREGLLKVFAYGGTERSPLLPDVPTISETVAPGFNVGTWFGFAAPAGTDDAVVDQLNTALLTVLDDPKLIEALAREGADVMGLDREETVDFLESETVRWATAIEQSGITVEN